MKMAKFQGLVFGLVVLSATASLGGKWVVAEGVHHVVGGDRGWDPSSDLSSWSSARTFRVGDKIWISYSAAQGLIAELKSKEEYESCDLRNPIKMYTDGLHTIPLEMEGIRYFVSSEPESCKSGLKLHVKVLPMTVSKSSAPASTIPKVEAEAAADADGPSTPSASPTYGGCSIPVLILMFCFAMLMPNV